MAFKGHMAKKHKTPPATGDVPYKFQPEQMKDDQGRYRTQNMFVEYATEGYEPLFTLKDYHREGIPSFKRLYVAIGDPTEYNTAMTLLGSWDHWNKLIEAPWLQEALAEAREELCMKLKSEAIERIRKDSKDAFSEATRLAANKFLATEGFASPENINKAKELRDAAPKRGRPTKEEVERRTVEALRENGTVDNDFNRVLGTPTKQ